MPQVAEEKGDRKSFEHFYNDVRKDREEIQSKLCECGIKDCPVVRTDGGKGGAIRESGCETV